MGLIAHFTGAGRSFLLKLRLVPQFWRLETGAVRPSSWTPQVVASLVDKLSSGITRFFANDGEKFNNPTLYRRLSLGVKNNPCFGKT